MDTKAGRVGNADQALVASDGAAGVSTLSGFDPSRDFYWFTNGWTMRREAGFLWHLRDADGQLVDRDRYRHDIIEAHDLTVVKHHDPFAIAMEAATAGETETGSTRSATARAGTASPGKDNHA